MTREQTHFRKVMGSFPTGVTVVTSRTPDGQPCGLTVNSVASVSLEPLLVLVCLDRAASAYRSIIRGGVFAISVLASGDEDVARRFAAGGDRFQGVELREEVTGSPIVSRALAWLDCRIGQIHEAGDHSILVGEVLACDVRDGEPLIFFRGRYNGMRT